MSTNNAAHTPGPWHIYETPLGVRISDKIVGDDPERNVTVCEFPYGWDDTPESAANGRLIAAAPELKATLFALGRGGANTINGQNRAEWETCRAAVAKVTGGAA